MRKSARSILLACVALLSLSRPGAAGPRAIELVNGTTPTLCAELDNVYVKLSGAGVRAFRIEARHPGYIGGLKADSTAPDFTGCDMSADPRYSFVPRSLVLFEDSSLKLVGHTFASFWRPNRVPIRIAERREEGLHLVQVLLKQGAGATEFLVLYPADGYWRLKPLPPVGLADNAYGSSFLVGPIEEHGRPLVDIREVRFDPPARTFHLSFADGGEASLAIAAIDPQRAELDVTLTPGRREGPFAALRSMFVSTAVADVAEVAWQSAADLGRSSLPIMAFERTEGICVRFGRSQPSRHNTSAPDLLFDRFRDENQSGAGDPGCAISAW